MLRNLRCKINMSQGNLYKTIDFLLEGQSGAGHGRRRVGGIPGTVSVWGTPVSTELLSKDGRCSVTVCRLLVPAAICVLMSSCSLSSYPVGDSEQPVEPSEWEGTWAGSSPGEGAVVFIVSVLDAEKGHLGVKWLQEDDGEIKLRESRGFLRATPGMTSGGWGDWLFVSVERKSADANGAVEYVWARVLKESDRALVWVPDSDKLGSLVAEGTLPGTKVRIRRSTRAT